MIALKHRNEVSVDEVTKARRSSLRESLALNTQRLLQTTASKLSSVASVCSVAINYLRKQRNLRLKTSHSTFVERTLQIHLFLKKQTQFLPAFSPKTTISPKPKPIQTQFKANLNPIQTQSCLNSAFSAVKIIPFYAKRTQTSPFLPQNRGFSQKTNPKRTQSKPNLYRLCNLGDI